MTAADLAPEERAALIDYALRLGDNCLILSHRVSEWCGHAPVLEEDIALANVALDLIGQTRLWLELAGELEGKGRDADRLAYRRDAGEFRNLLMVEQPNGDFAQTMIRQVCFDLWQSLMLEQLQESGHARVAEIAQKSAKEVAYHLTRSRDLTVRLGDGSEESHRRMQAAVEELWPFTGEMVSGDGVDEILAAAGIGADMARVAAAWQTGMAEILAAATLIAPQEVWMQSGGKTGRHSEQFGYILAEMQFLQRAYPDATW
ncbi:MAG: phenylacetate-CoA oxygenase subunit PaaC [Rhodospirillales bacterium]